jgi:hypothetical protein
MELPGTPGAATAITQTSGILSMNLSMAVAGCFPTKLKLDENGGSEAKKADVSYRQRVATLKASVNAGDRNRLS